MAYTQVKPFNTSLGGTVPNMCLANVTKGYGIPNRYASAWEAWVHTRQHTDPIPTGVDVPLYYSYTATIDGVTQNYGHINVRLANGTVWSDGNIYPSIEAYTNTHWPKFVGWGESVNDVIVIKGEVMAIAEGQINDNDDIAELWRLAFFRDPSSKEVQDNQGLIGKYWNDASKYLRTTDAFKQVTAQYNAGAGVVPYSGSQLYVKKG